MKKISKNLIRLGNFFAYKKISYGQQKILTSLPEYKTREPDQNETRMEKSTSYANSHRHSRILFDQFPGSRKFKNMLEVGGLFSKNSMSIFPELDYHNLDLEKNSKIPTIVGDITDCNNIPSNSFDLIVSHQTFEHISKPWLAAQNISSMLKPGGLCYVSTVWAWRYHPVPIDYWRFSPDCLSFLFQDLEKIEANFNSASRRSDIRGI